MQDDQEEELQEYNIDPQEMMSLDSVSVESAALSKRGPKKIPEKWTRVISMSHDDLRNLRIFETGTDLLIADGYEKVGLRGRPAQWKPIFMPKLFVEEHKEITLEEFKVKEQDFKRCGHQLSTVRAELRENALKLDKMTAQFLEKKLSEVSKVAKKMSRFEMQERQKREEHLQEDFAEETAPLLRRKLKNRSKLSLSEKVSIAHKVFVEHEKLIDVAKEFRIHVSTANNIASKIRKNPKVLEEEDARLTAKESKRQAILRTVLSKLARNDFIDSAESVKKQVNETTD